MDFLSSVEGILWPAISFKSDFLKFWRQRDIIRLKCSVSSQHLLAFVCCIIEVVIDIQLNPPSL